MGELVVSDAADRHGIPAIETIDTVCLGGLPVAVIDRPRSARLMVDLALARRETDAPPFYVTSANGQVLSLCAFDPDARALFASADLIHADGMPLVFASRWRGRKPLPERVATTDLFHDVAQVAAPRGARFYLLGGTEDVIQKAERNVRRLYPDLDIVGCRNGYFDTGEEEAVVDAINAAAPDILWVAMGVPREQAFVVRNRLRLARVGLVKTSGGLFDFLAGARSRAPQWMQDAGLEWLYRVWLEPRRLLVRYALTNPHAIHLLLTRSR
jgi:N-acetylglucosaminyldiphosphoundecaprenol N-acetyl-beta-D-mannosaminyltransferase